MANFDHISHFHKDQLLHVVSYHMRSDMRRIMMRECPAAYNSLCGRTVVTSQVEDTGDKVIYRPENVDLLSIREQIQEDLICLLVTQFDDEGQKDEVQRIACQIVVDNFNKLN